MIKYSLQMFLLLCCLLVTACASTTGTREEFEKNVKDYNRLLRWHEIPTAGMTYIVPEEREPFLKSAEKFKKQHVTITDYRILAMECLPDKGTGESITEFDYYILPSNRIKTLIYSQEWVYRAINDTNGWRLKTVLPAFE